MQGPRIISCLVERVGFVKGRMFGSIVYTTWYLRTRKKKCKKHEIKKKNDSHNHHVCQCLLVADYHLFVRLQSA